MTANPIHSEPAAVSAIDVRLCGHCGRPLPALHKNEYTPTRAHLVTTAGFCVCRSDGHDEVARIPDHGPSLL